MVCDHEREGGARDGTPSKRDHESGTHNSLAAAACKRIPVVRAFVVSRLPGGMLRVCFWCGWCRGWHFHGVGDDELPWPGGHRLGHCWRPSPLVAGYHVLVVGASPKWCRRPDGRIKSRLGPAKARRLAEAVP